MAKSGSVGAPSPNAEAVSMAETEGQEAMDFAKALSDINKKVQAFLAAIEKINSWWNKAASV